jgi:hypothetical protein
MPKSNPKIYSFRFRTGEIVIDHSACLECETYACLKADRLFGTNVLRIQDGRPVLTLEREDAVRVCNECLGCEIYCQAYGNKGLTIKLDKIGLETFGGIKE